MNSLAVRVGFIGAICSLSVGTAVAQDDDIDLNPDFDETIIVDSVMKFNVSVGTTRREFKTRLRGRGSPAARQFASRPPRSVDAARGLGSGPSIRLRKYADGEIRCDAPYEDDYFDEGYEGSFPSTDQAQAPEDSCFLIPSGGTRVRGGAGVAFTQEGRSVSVQDPAPIDFGFGGPEQDLGSFEAEEFGKEVTFEFGPINLFLRPFGINRQDIRIYLMGRFSHNTYEETFRANTFRQQFTRQQTRVTDTFPLNEFGDFTGQPGDREFSTTSREVVTEDNMLIQDTDFESLVFTLGPAIHYDPEWVRGLYFVFELFAGVGRAEAETQVTDIFYRDVNGRRSEVGRVQFDETDSDWTALFGFNFHTRIEYAHIFIGIYTGFEYMQDLEVQVGGFESEFSQDAWRNGAYIGWGI